MLLRLIGVTVLAIVQFTVLSDVSKVVSERKSIGSNADFLFICFRHKVTKTNDASASAQASTLS